MNRVDKVLHKPEYYTFINRKSPTINNNYAFLSTIDGFLRHKSYFLR